MTDSSPTFRSYDDTAAAMQNEMLSIDEEYNEQWFGIMLELVAAKLNPTEFTMERIIARRGWERRRRAAQARLRWKYAVGKRKGSLIERDVKAQLAQVRKRPEQAQ